MSHARGVLHLKWFI